MCRSMCMYKWVFVGTKAHTYVLGSTRDKKYEKNLGTQYLLWCLRILFYYYYYYYYYFFFSTMLCIYYYYFFGVHCYVHIFFFFLRQIFWKLRAKFGIHTNLGSIYIFSFLSFLLLLFWDSKFVQISNWVVQWFGMLDLNTLRGLIVWDLKFVWVSNRVVWRFGTWVQTRRGGIIWDFKFVQVSNWVVQRFDIWIQTRWEC